MCFLELIDDFSKKTIKGKKKSLKKTQEIPHEGAFGDIVWSDPEDIESWAAEALNYLWQNHPIFFACEVHMCRQDVDR